MRAHTHHHRDATGLGRERDRGFTLVELLIVIVILGILATITVFAVRGITSEGEESACASDRKNIETAEESHMAQEGGYASEAVLVEAGLLRAESANLDVAVGLDGQSYTTSYVGQCVGVGTSSPVGPSTPTGPSSNITTTTIAGLPAQSWGTGPINVVMMSAAPLGSRSTDLLASLDAGYLPPTHVTIYAVDLSSLPGVDIATASTLVNASNTLLAWFGGDIPLLGGNPGDTLLGYLDTNVPAHGFDEATPIQTLSESLAQMLGLVPRP